MLNGLVVKALWEWFVVSTFGLGSLNFIQAAGLSLLISYLTSNYHTQEELTYKILIYKASYDVTTPLTALIIGFLLHLA